MASWGSDVTVTLHLSNGETLTRTLTVEDLREDAGDNADKARETLIDIVDVFRSWRTADYIAMKRDGKDIYINPAHVLYVITEGFSSWDEED